MKFLICGTLVPGKYETKIEHLSNAANRFLLNYCNALAKQKRLAVASYLGIPVEDDVKEMLSKEEKAGWDISYYFASRYKIKGILEFARGLKKQIKDCDCVVAYNTVYAWLLLPIWARRMKKKSVLLLADYSPAESYNGKLRKLYANLQLKSIRRYDYVIGLSENVRAYLQPEQRFMCMEGGIAKSFFDYYAKEKKYDEQKIYVQYAGILEPVTGIDRLMEAFHSIEDASYVLRISGKGSLAADVKEMAVMDERIQYLGCPAYEQYMSNLYQADILVNPRNMELKENENNFPSKIMEYLATGKYVVSTKFPGWERYRDHIAFCKSDVSAIKEQLLKVAAGIPKQKKSLFEERRKFAEQFIWENQIERFLLFISDLN